MQQHEELTLTKFIDPQDELDSEIVNDTINMIVALNMNDILFMGDKKLSENFFGKVMDLTQSLLKANEHFRSYISKEKDLLEKHKEYGLNNPNKNTNLGVNPISLNNEIDGVLSQIKAALDTLARALNPMFSFKLNGWHKDKKGKSGVDILKMIKNNLPENLKINSNNLYDYIENNSGYISYIVYLRDGPHHRGGLKNITQIVFDYKLQNVIAQKIIHPDGTEELMVDFLLRTIKTVKNFINGVLILSMHLKMGVGLVIVKNDNGNYPPYSWGIPNKT